MLCLGAGPILVKAAVLTVVEKLQAAGISMLYSGPLDNWSKVLLSVTYSIAKLNL